MTEEKKSVWTIRHRSTIIEKVLFSHEVTAVEAEEMFHHGLEEDILNTDIDSLDAILACE